MAKNVMSTLQAKENPPLTYEATATFDPFTSSPKPRSPR
jgi:hypothetical protein